VTTNAAGRYLFNNLTQNPYHLFVHAEGFQPLERDVDVRTGVPITVDIALLLAGATTTVEVVGHSEDLLERDPTAHTDIDQSLISKLPLESSSGLNQVITLASPGVVSDSNGFFHPIGDHAQTQFRRACFEAFAGRGPHRDASAHDLVVGLAAATASTPAA